MSDRKQVQALKDLFKKSRQATREPDGWFEDLKLHNAVGEALIDVGKEKIYELADEIYMFLNDPFAEFRAEAVKTLGWYSRLGIEEFCRNQAYTIWERDPDEDVKAVALAAWEEYYKKTKDPEVLSKLYMILTSEKYSSRIRAYALDGIYDVANAWEKPGEEYDVLIKMGELNNPIEFNQGVDWERVNRIMQECIPGWKESKH